MGCLNSIFKMWPDKNVVQGEEDTGGKGREGSFYVDETRGVTNGKVGLRSSSQSLDQLALAFREFWIISWRLRGGR